MIAFDAASTGIVTGAVLTYSHTTSGANRFMYITVRSYTLPSSVAYAGVNATKVDDVTTGGVSRSHWYLINPASGANNVVVTTAADSSVQAASNSYTGVSQTAQPDAITAIVNKGSVTSTSVATTSVADNCWHLMCAVLSNGRTLTAGANTTLRTTGQYSGGTVWLPALLDSNSAKTPAGSVTLNVNLDTADTVWAGGITIAPYVATAAGGKNLYGFYEV